MNANLTAPPRGFAQSEFETRTAKAQALMAEQKLDALLLTTEPNFRYFSGFHSQFWESPTRPWFLVVPAEGRPIAVIPEIGVAGMGRTWIEDIRSWPAPEPEDDGVTLLAQALRETASRHGRIGLPQGHETYLRMPLADYQVLTEQLGNTEVADATAIMRRLRDIKSPAEIEKIRYVCQLTSQGFESLPGRIGLGESEREITRKLRLDLLERGADSTPFMVAGSGPDGYDDIIMGPGDREMADGDVLIIDTGTLYDGYFCDFDRNFAFGEVSDETKRAYTAVYRATDAGIAAARPGATCADLHRAMWGILEQAGALGNSVGRMGHGLGIQLTEGPSHKPGDETVLEPGMVLTIEPGMEYAPGKMTVHEENILVTEAEAELLTIRAPEEMWRVG